MPEQTDSKQPSSEPSEAQKKRKRSRARKKLIKRIITAVVVVAVIALAVIAFRPRPTSVDTATARRGPLVISLVEPGKTRLRDRHIVRAPIAGNLTRVELWEGDTVEADTVLARLVAIAAPLLSVNDRRQAQARLAGSRAALKAARADAERARLAVEQIEDELARITKLTASGAMATVRKTDLEHALREARQVATSSKFRVSVAQGEMSAAEAVLGIGEKDRDAPGQIELTAPITGVVLRVLRRDAGPVATGEPLIEIGSMSSLEVVVEVLTADAVGIPDNARVILRGWGGDEDAVAQVGRVEPAGFTRISALGVEEQRVNVIARFDDKHPAPRRLGDGFRVEAEIVLAETADALLVPSGAVFRDGTRWAVYKLDGGKAALTTVEVGSRGDFDVEIRSGLGAGDEVIIHPSDALEDGSSVERR